jgi:adhesin/invasin
MMMRYIFYSLIAILLTISISGCGDSNSSTTTPSNVQIALQVDKNIAVADGTDGVTLTATVTDPTGAPITGQEVQINVPPTLWFSNIPTTPLITDDNGQVALFLCPAIRLQHDVPLQSQLDSVTATCLGSISNSVEITINPGPSMPTGSVTFVSDKVQAVADNRDSITFTATVKDKNGVPIPDQLVHFAIIGGSGLAVIALRYTNINGQASISYRYPTTLFTPLGTDFTFNATSGGVASNLITVTYTKPVTAQVSLKSNKTQAIANGSDTIAITATVYDGKGYPIPYQTISFNVSPGANRFMSPVSTDINGKAVIQLSVSPTPTFITDKVITVSAASGGITSPTINLTYTPPPQVTPALVTLTSDKTVMLADGTDRITFTIFASDSNGVGIAGQLYRLYPPPGPYSAATNIVTNALGQGLSSLMYNIYGFPRLAVSTTIPITAMVNGTISNTIFITMNPP